MNWPAQDAEARFDEMLDACRTGESQIITVRGVETAVLLKIEDWRRLQGDAQPTLKDLLLGDEPRADLDIPDRRRFRRRPSPDFD